MTNPPSSEGVRQGAAPGSAPRRALTISSLISRDGGRRPRRHAPHPAPARQNGTEPEDLLLEGLLGVRGLGSGPHRPPGGPGRAAGRPARRAPAAEDDGAVEHGGSAAGDRAGLEQRGDLVVGEDRHRLLRWRGMSMPSVGATSSSPSVTGHRQNRRIPRSRVPTVEGSAVSAGHAATARRVGSSSTGCRPRSVSRRAALGRSGCSARSSGCFGSGPSRPEERPEDYARSPAGRGLSVE